MVTSIQVKGKDLIVVFITGAAFRYFDSAHLFDDVMATRSVASLAAARFEQIN